MVNELKNIILAGIGSAAYTYEKAGKVVDDLVARGKLTVEEGKELSEELKRNIVNKTDAIKPLNKEDLIEVLKSMNFATKDDLAAVNERISKLEETK
jgi:polyhydroxyalkanoate synthesis regulator phasin